MYFMNKIKDIIFKVEELKSTWNYKEAINLIKESLKEYDDYMLYEELADIYLYTKNNQKARKAADFAIKLNPKSATWNYLKWFISIWENNFEEALWYLKTSNKLNPNNSEVLRNLWWAYINLEDWFRWINILKRALNITPGDELILEDLAMWYISIWEIEKWNKILEKLWKK